MTEFNHQCKHLPLLKYQRLVNLKNSVFQDGLIKTVDGILMKKLEKKTNLFVCLLSTSTPSTPQ